MIRVSKKYDVIVVGAGPAGSVTAGTLASNGHSVLLIDKECFPRNKVCGDGLTGDSIRMLTELGLWDSIAEKSFKSEYVELYPFKNKSFILKSPVYTFKREEFDNDLKEWAIGNGAEFRNLRFCGDVSQKGTEIECWDSDKNKFCILKGRIIIFAMGCQPDSFVAERTFTENKIKSDIIAVRGYCKAAWNIDHPLVFFSKELKEGYIWIFPMGDNIYNVGCGTRQGKLEIKSILNNFLKNNKYTKKASYRWEVKPEGAFINAGLCNIDSAVKNNILLVGETLGTTYPFTGEGIGKALESGYLAAKLVSDALNEDDFKRLKYYPFLLEQKIKHAYKPYEIAERIFKRKYIGTILYYCLCCSKTLSNCVSDILSERKKPNDIKSVRLLYKILSKVSRI